MKYIPTAEKVTVENYPYGYTLKTTLFDTLEFSEKKGYRHVTQTINPKNGRLNNPKKSTYDDVKVRYYDENNHIKVKTFSFFTDGVKGLNRFLSFLAENKEVFTTEEIKHFCLMINAGSKVSMKSMVIYCGSKLDDLKPYFEEPVKALNKGVNNPLEVDFSFIRFDEEGIESTKVEGYNPFKTTSYVIDTN